MIKSKQAWSGNIGEWSEPYVVYKLLSDGRLCQADKDFRPSKDDFVEILSVIRADVIATRYKTGFVAFKSTDVSGGGERNIVSVKDIAAKAKKLFKEMSSKTHKSSGAFRIPWLEYKLKAQGFKLHKNPTPFSGQSAKRDISLKVHDPKSGGTPLLGFSVKSEIGAPPALCNASEVTNIVYRIHGLSKSQANAINAYHGQKKIIWKCKQISELASKISFEKFDSKIFEENLDVIDAALPKIIAELVRVHYFEMLIQPRAKVKGMKRPHDRLTMALSMLNRKAPYRSHSRKDYCEIKVKRFLRACALGMDPGKVWNDVDDANGGYIIVLPDGQLIGFYVYNRKLFEDYLLKETVFERGSTKKHRYMRLEPDAKSGDFLLKLNLGIRFAER